jgi:hypothetical protein
VKYGLGTSLCDAARTMSCDKFRHFLIAWRDRLREVLRMDPQGLIGRRNPACAENVTDTFPDPDIVHSYLNPLTSLSHGQTLPSVNGRIPDLARLGELCERYFEWATPAGILPKFHKHVWPGVVLRMIREDILNTDALPDTANCLAQVRALDSVTFPSTKYICRRSLAIHCVRRTLPHPMSYVRERWKVFQSVK